MNNPSGFSQIQEFLNVAKKILVVLPQKLTFDKVAAGLAAYLSLKKSGKQISIICPQRMTVEYSRLVGVNKVALKAKGRNLIVSFDYVEDAIEKVSYNIENGKFNLLIQPKEGKPPLHAQNVRFSYSGIQVDLVLVIGALSLSDLGNLYSSDKQLFAQDKVVNLDIREQNSRFGKINLVSPQAASYSEVAAELLYRLKLSVDVDIANNLLQGIEKATQVFASPKVGASTFEAAAFCMRAGARRHSGEKPTFRPMEKMAPEKPVEEKKEKPSPDWLEPKIYKGNTLA